ncbi:MAG: hydrogenase maturation nickel metallochaperone HypA [Halothiobacillus sp.]|jgi:hydrogenase nickel incorporation protein HypA/HybF|nr:hydrogenase maturation nickel metallochaperone HypA [Halothiobacillus sp.]
MHELSLCQSLVRQASRVATEHGARHIRRISVRIGFLSGVEADLMQHAFPFASRGTPAEGAKLEMELCPVRVYCPQCNNDSEVPANNRNCPHCGQWQTLLSGGEELLLTGIDLEPRNRTQSPPRT